MQDCAGLNRATHKVLFPVFAKGSSLALAQEFSCALETKKGEAFTNPSDNS